MRKSFVVAILVVALLGFAAVATAGDVKDVKKGKVAVYDDCDPADEAWDETGGCSLEGGKVTLAEFSLLLFSPLAGGTVIGHPAWRMEPSYLRLRPEGTLIAENEGGRTHTFTKVASFGGGFIPDLNGPLLLFAPECATASPILPGEVQEFGDLAPGDHLFQCCIHPWMRFQVKVNAEEQQKATGGHHGHH